MRYVLHNKAIRLVLTVIAVTSVLGRGALEMLPAYADAVLNGGSRALALLTSAIGFGAVIAGIILSRGTAWLHIGVDISGVMAGGVLIAMLGFVETFWPAALLIAMLGFVLSLCGVGSQILMQTLVDDEIRGRVSSLWGMVTFGGTALGGLLVGAAASIQGLTTTIVGTGILCTLLAMLIASRRRSASLLQSG